MGPDSLSRELADDSETILNLERTFRHPAGLQTARLIVRSLLAKQRSTQASLANEMASSLPSIMDSSSSPEVAALLNQILAINDSQTETPDQRLLGAHINSYQSDDIEAPPAASMVLPASNSMQTQRLKHRGSGGASLPFEHTSTTPYLSQPKPTTTPGIPDFHIPPPYRPQWSVRSPESEMDSLFGSQTDNRSSSQGTESPYRVESPAIRGSNVTPLQSSAQRPGDRHTFFGENSGMGASVPHNRLPPLQSALSAPPIETGPQIHHPSPIQNPPNVHHASLVEPVPAPGFAPQIHYASEGATSGSSFSHVHTLPSANRLSLPATNPVLLQSSNLAMRSSPTIKSFLPVNKTLDMHNKDCNELVASQQSPAANALPSDNRKDSAAASTTSLDAPPRPTDSSVSSFTASQFVFDISSTSNKADGEPETLSAKKVSQKRKLKSNGAPGAKKKKADNTSKPKRAPKVKKVKEPKPEPAKFRLSQDLWMRILEFCPPQFLSKARLINKTFKAMVDEFDSIFVNCRQENYGWDMPSPPKTLTERQYSDLFGGKGCLEPGCSDDKTSRTHWSWCKRWCHDCWKSKIEREDRALKARQNAYGRPTLTKMFECIPVGMHDSFMKPHDYIDDIDSRPRAAPRLYKYYLTEDIERIIAQFEALRPPPFKENPNHTAAEKATALAAHQALLDALEEKQNEFFAAGKAENDAHMAKVQKIEMAVRKKRDENRQPYDENRAARKELFTRRAREDIPQIDEAFVQSTMAFKAATRIFRDGGTERGWQMLKPKIEKEWEEAQQEAQQKMDARAADESAMSQAAGSHDVEEAEEDELSNDQMDVDRPEQTNNASHMSVHMYRSMMQRQIAQRSFGVGPMMASSRSQFSSPMDFGNSLMADHLRQQSLSNPVRGSASYYGNYHSSMTFRQSNGSANYNAFASGSGRVFTNQPSGYSTSQFSSSSGHVNASQSAGPSHQAPRTQISISSLLQQPHNPTNASHFNPFS